MIPYYTISRNNFFCSSFLICLTSLAAFPNLCSASTPLWHADRAHTEGDLDTAQKAYQAVLEKDPGNLTAHYNAALTAYMAQDYGTAEQLFRTFTQQPSLQDQQKIEGFFNHGDCQLHLKKYQDAIDSYATVLALDPNHKEAVKRKQIAEELLKEQQRQEQEQQQQQQKDQQDQEQQDQDQDQQDTDQQQQNGQGQQQDQKQQEQDQRQNQKQDQQKQPEPQDRDQQKDQEQKQEQEQQDQQSQDQEQDEQKEPKTPQPQDKKNARQTKKSPQQKPQKDKKEGEQHKQPSKEEQKKEDTQPQEQKATGKTERTPEKKQLEKKAGAQAPAEKSGAEKAKEALAQRLTPAEKNLLDAVEEEEGKLYKAWLKSGLERADTEPEDREHAKNW